MASFYYLLLRCLPFLSLIFASPSSHLSHPLTLPHPPSLTHTLRARQAVAAPKAEYAASLLSARAAGSLKQYRALYAVVDKSVEEVGRQVGRLRKSRRKERGERGEKLQAALHSLLEDLTASGDSYPVVEAKAAVASASPSPAPASAARPRRKVSSASMPEQAAHVLAIVLNLVQTATAKVDAVLHLLGKDQRTSIEATLDELRWELNLLVEGSALRIPGIVELPSLSSTLASITGNATEVNAESRG